MFRIEQQERRCFIISPILDFKIYTCLELCVLFYTLNNKEIKIYALK